MAVRIKICGLKTAVAMEAALAARVDMVGLVFYPKSPRHLSLDAAAVLAKQARGRADIVALTVDADDAQLTAIVDRLKPDLLQLHGAETPERCAAVRAMFAVPVMKAIAVETAADAAACLAYAAADLILFDAKAPKGATLPGGNGIAFDWHALDAVKAQVRWMLSGGLTPANVAAAIRLTGATAVDVSSGVERAPGDKDAALIDAFVRAARSAQSAQSS